MALYGNDVTLTSHNSEIFNFLTSAGNNGHNAFIKRCAYKPNVSVNEEGFISYRQEYTENSIPYSFTLSYYMTNSDFDRLITEIGEYSLLTKTASPTAAWELSDQRIKGVSKTRFLGNLLTPLIFDTYLVVPVQFGYNEIGNTHKLISLELLEVK